MLALLVFLAAAQPAVSSAAAPPVVITPEQESYPLGLHLDYLEDKQKTLTISDVASEEMETRFTRSTSATPGFGFTSSAYWLRFTIINSQPETVHYYIEAEYPLLDSIALYTPAAGNRYAVVVSGDHLPFHDREIQYRNFVFEIRLPPGAAQTYYMRCETTSSMNLPLTLLSPAALSERIATEQTLLGIYYGILFTMLVFSLFVFISLQDITFLYYVLFIAGFMLFQLSLNGMAFQYLWPNQIWWANNNIPFFICFAHLFATQFTRLSLNTARNAPLLDLIMKVIVVISVLAMVISLFAEYAISIRLATVLAISAVVLIIAGFTCAVRGYRPAVYYSIAWSALIISVAAYGLKAFGVLPNNFFTSWGLQIGSAWEVIILSMGLADRFHLMEKETLRRQSAEAASQAKSDFLANMSHEIRTPMNAILGMANLALKQPVPPKLRNYLRVINDASHSLLGVINDILDFSKIEAGRLDIEHTAFDLNTILDNLADMFSSKIAEKERVEMFITVEEHTPEALVGDPLRLKQVLINLVSNAIKFTEAGEILVTVRCLSETEEGATLEFTVSDTGSGMKPEQIPSLFDQFTQADSSTTRKYGGTGLGLPISRQLITMMGGEIVARSKPGRGSAFTFTVKLGLQNPSGGRIRPLPAQLCGLRVLVVDDNPTIRRLLEKMLEPFSCTVTTAASAAEALGRLGGPQRPYDLLITDLNMPDMDGVELAERTRNTVHCQNMPVIMISALGNEKALDKSATAVVDAFISKPIKRTLLLNTILELTGCARPAKAGEEAIRCATSSDGREHHLAGSRILLAEDNAINQQVAREMLEEQGIAVAIANNGREAVEAVQQSRFDAVLMDVQMPEMDGFEATAVIRRTPALRDLPVIAMTAHAMKGYREKCIDAGMNDYIAKPVEEEQLLGTLRKWLGTAERPLSTANASEGTDEKPSSRQQPTLLLEGIDTAAGLKRLRGKRDFYVKLLKEFARDYSSAPDEIRNALLRQDFGQAQRLAHTIKGLAGNLAARQIEALAHDIERAAARKVTVEAPLLDAFDAAFAVVMQSIAGLEDKEEPCGGAEIQPAGDCSPEEIEAVMVELADFLRQNNLQAEDCFLALRKRINDPRLTPHLEEIGGQLDSFNFKEARRALDALAAALKINLQPEKVRTEERKS